MFRLVEARQLPHHLVQDQPRFDRVDLLEHATKRRMRVATELFEDARATVDGSRLRVSRLLEAGGIHRAVAGTTPATLLGALTRVVELPEGIDRDVVAAIVEARGGLNPVGNGIALPHSRAPVAVAPHGPLLALGFPLQPIACETPDGKPVQAAFLIISPSIRIHLDVLSKLGAALLDPDLQALLSRRASDDELLDRLRQLEAAPLATGAGEARRP